MFYADLDSLKASVRLTDLPEDGDGYSIFVLALGAAHATMFERLGGSTIAAIQATADASPPTNDLEVKKLRMKQVESDLLLKELMARLPYGTSDAVASGLEMFDTEAPFRLMSLDEIEAAMLRLERSANTALEAVSGNQGEGSIRWINYGNPTPPRYGTNRGGLDLF